MLKKSAGVYQLNNGFWGYRFVITVNGETRSQRRMQDEKGKPYKTEKQAAKAREAALKKVQRELKQAAAEPKEKKMLTRKTVEDLYLEYCEKGRKGKAYATIKKQDSLWKNHIKERFGDKYIDEISVAEIEDYLEELYFIYDYAYSYVESFLKMFYLIFGQAYSRDYLDMDRYNKICVNKDTKIHMPKMKADEDTDIVSFDKEEIQQLDNYFRGTNAETAYLIGKYCGLRINECYGLKWENIDLEKGIIHINQQMQYQDGIIKLVPVKTRNAKRSVFMGNKLKVYMKMLYRKYQQDCVKYALQRQQNQIFIEDTDGQMISSLGLVNTLSNGKRQTVNSMKYHTKTIEERYGFKFKFHYLRHTYGTRMAVLNTPSHLLCNQMGHASIHITQKYYLSISKDGIQTLLNNLNRYDEFSSVA